MNSQELEESHNRFIEFGGVFDKPTRIFLVHYIYSKVSGKEINEFRIQQLLTNLDSNYYNYLQKTLDKMFFSEIISQTGAKYEALSHQITEDMLKWLKNTDRKLAEKNPYTDENDRFGAWSHKPTFLWLENWYVLTNYLKDIYKKEELDTSFYVEKFKLFTQINYAKNETKAISQIDTEKIELLINDLLAAWSALLTAKNLQYLMEEIEKEADQFTEILLAKIEEFNKIMNIVSPFAMEISNFWDMSQGLWKNANFNVLDHYQSLLQNEKSIQELVDLLGRMREAQIELEEEVFQNVMVHKDWVTDYRLKTEVGGTYPSDDLNNLLPTEAALLGGDTELLFLQKYADKTLNTYRYQGKSLVHSNKVHFFSQQRQKRKEKGAFILCIDTSGSMDGLPAQIAKVLTFAIMKMAAQEQRKAYLISFAIGIKTINLLEIANSMDKIVEFLAMSFDGGTDVTPAMSAALTMIQTNDYKDADVLMVSDFVMFDIREDILLRMQQEQQKGTKFHCLTLSDKSNYRVIEQFDNYWVYDPETRGIMKTLLEVVKEIK
jgi:uncharacterized protein with von Willebrand factor type A (vWA) domain